MSAALLLLLPLGRDGHSYWLGGAEWFGLFSQGLGFAHFMCSSGRIYSGKIKPVDNVKLCCVSH